MRIGTKSVLFGAHAFWIHPFFVALAWWLYLPRVILSGEIHEYMGLCSDPNGKYAHEALLERPSRTRREWHERMTNYCAAWAYQHVDWRPDTWTPDPQPPKPVRTV